VCCKSVANQDYQSQMPIFASGNSGTHLLLESSLWDDVCKVVGQPFIGWQMGHCTILPPDIQTVLSENITQLLLRTRGDLESELGDRYVPVPASEQQRNNPNTHIFSNSTPRPIPFQEF
jgi:hypothetical protein